MDQIVGYLFGVVSVLLLGGIVYLFLEQQKIKDTLSLQHDHIILLADELEAERKARRFLLEEVETEKAARLRKEERTSPVPARALRVSKAARKTHKRRSI